MLIIWLKTKRAYWKSPRYMRLIYWYVPATFATLALFPAAQKAPPAAILVVAAASFCTAYIASALTGIRVV